MEEGSGCYRSLPGPWRCGRGRSRRRATGCAWTRGFNRCRSAASRSTASCGPRWSWIPRPAGSGPRPARAGVRRAGRPRGPRERRGGGGPAAERAVQLLEGYAAYSRDFLSLKLGRTHDVNRLGWVGFDGAKLEIRPLGRALHVFGYGGRALARNFPLPVTSADLNPLGDSLELPNRDQILLAGGVGWFIQESGQQFSGRVLYQREDRRGGKPPGARTGAP